MTNAKISWIAIVSLSAIAAFLVCKFFFPQIIEQLAAGIIAFFAFLIGLIFRRKKSGT